MFSFFKKKSIVSVEPYHFYIVGNDTHEVYLINGLTLGSVKGWLESVMKSEQGKLCIDCHEFGKPLPDHWDTPVQEVREVYHSQIRQANAICELHGTTLIKLITTNG